MLYPQTATVNHSYIEESRLVDKVFKKHLMNLEKSNLELTENKVRLQTDTLILISADSDLVPTVEFIKEHFPEKLIKVCFPPCR